MKTYAFFSAAKSMALLLALTMSAHLCSLGAELVLEDEQLRVGFDSESGALTTLESKLLHWIVERRAELGASFRLLVPVEGRRDNFVLGTKQRAVEAKRVSDQEIR